MKNALVIFYLAAALFASPSLSAEREELIKPPAEMPQDMPLAAEGAGFAESELSGQAELYKGAEKIKVTGSRVKRIDVEGARPLAIWTKEDLGNSGYFSFSDFFQNTSLSNFGGIRIHNRSTLTLVNGSRLVYENAPDLIPVNAIERVEILKDGASALYGSDVVGGVINIITKKDFSAPEFSLKLAPTAYPFYKGGSQAEGSAVFGRSFNKGRFISAWQFQYDDGLKTSQRKKWHADYFFDISPYARFKIKESEEIFVDPRCPEELKTREESKVIGCNHSSLPYTYIEPRVYYFSSYNYAEYKTRGLSFYAQWFGFAQKSKEPDQLILDEDLEIPSGHKMSYGGGRAGDLTHIFEDLYSDELTNTAYVDSLAGIKGYISKTWDFDISLKWSNIWIKKTYTQRPYLEDLQRVIFSGQYDPFDRSRRSLSKVRRHDAVYRDSDTRFFSSWDFSGESGFWDIDLALGAQAYYNKYREHADSEVREGKIYSLAAAETLDLPSRFLSALYAEAVKNFSSRWEIQAAGRIDSYSDWIRRADPESKKEKLEINSKWTANPKLAIYFKPSEDFLFRASAGTSFELPALSNLYTAETTGYIGIYDTVACYNELKENNHFAEIEKAQLGEGFESPSAKDQLIKEFLIEQSAVVESQKVSETGKSAFKNLANKLDDQTYCRTKSFKGSFKGNKNLKETKALTASLGFHWQLSGDHSLTADYWLNSLSGTPIGSLHRNKKTIDAELRHGKARVEKYGVQYERDNSRPYSPIKNPVHSLINIGGKKLSGMDLKWESNFPHWTLGKGSFYFKDEFAYVIKSGVELFPGMGYVNNLGKFGLPKWRNFITVGWKSARHDLSLLLKSSAGVKKLRNEFESLPLFHIADLFYQYKYDSRFSVRLGWYNLFFSDPALDDSIKRGAKYDRDFFNARGPRFFVELRRGL